MTNFKMHPAFHEEIFNIPEEMLAQINRNARQKKELYLHTYHTVSFGNSCYNSQDSRDQILKYGEKMYHKTRLTTEYVFILTNGFFTVRRIDDAYSAYTFYSNVSILNPPITPEN